MDGASLEQKTGKIGLMAFGLKRAYSGHECAATSQAVRAASGRASSIPKVLHSIALPFS